MLKRGLALLLIHVEYSEVGDAVLEKRSRGHEPEALGSARH